jgi:hypothetical protein
VAPVADLTRSIVSVFGRSGSGKTNFLSRRVAPAFPRRITFDLTGETEKLYPGAVQLRGARATFTVLRELWRRRVDRWHLCVSAPTDEIAAVVAHLCPLHDGAALSLAGAWGGIAVESFELDTLFPVGLGSRAWETAYLRGRHVGLSLLCASQYPALVHRAASSQSTRIVLFSLIEPRQVDYARRLLGPVGDRVRSLPLYHCLDYDVLAAVVVERGPDGRRVRSWRLAEGGA